MGVVVPFKPRPKSSKPTARAERAVVDAAKDGSDFHAVLNAAEPLLALCRDRHGFTVMREGLPLDPDALATALVSLLRAMELAEAETGKRRLTLGFGVYFGRPALEWFDDDGGGSRALAVPNDTEAHHLAAFISPRLRALAQPH